MSVVRITKLDFVPKRGNSYNCNWPGPPRRRLRYSDLKHYKPIINLKNRAPAGFWIGVYAKEERTWASNPELSYFMVRFDAGSKTPKEIRMLNHIKGPPRDVKNSPKYTKGSFWLGCGKRGKIRGNIGTGDDRHARVYLELFSTIWQPDDPRMKLRGKRKSRRHTVRGI